MAIFQSIGLSWGGRDFTVPADKVMGAICVVEDVATFQDLMIMMSGRPNLSRLACAYAALLRYAGATVGNDEVYNGLFKPGEMHQQIAAAINTLLALMTPPSAVAEAPSEGNRKAAPSNLSRKRTKRR